MPIVRRPDCVPPPVVVCPVVALVMLESWVERFAHIFLPNSPVSQQLQQDRQLQAVERSLTS